MAVKLSRSAMNGFVKAVSGHGVDTTTTFGNSSVGLFSAPFSGDVNSVLADLSEANYPGYARQAMASIHAPIVDGALRSVFEPQPLVWVPSGDDSANTIYGWFAVGGDGTTLLAWEQFAAPVPLPTAFAQLITVIEVGLTPGSDFGAGSVLS